MAVVPLWAVRLLTLALVCVAHSGQIRESGESKLAPRPGTLCQLLSRDILTEEKLYAGTLAVHRLRFALPASARIPDCCGGSGGLFHVRVKAPDATGQMQFRPYSAHMLPTNRSIFELIVKVYPGGVSAKLGALAVDDYAHVPEIQAIDWRRDSKRVGMVCFGVGITECLGPAERLLKAGGEVRLVTGYRNAEQMILVDEARALLREYAGRFRLRHCLSQPEPGAALDRVKAGKEHNEKITRGRVDHKVLKAEFGGPWNDGQPAEHFLTIGTSQMERAALGLLGRAGLIDFSQVRSAAQTRRTRPGAWVIRCAGMRALGVRCCSERSRARSLASAPWQIRGHPLFLLIKGPYGANSNWEALSPPDKREPTSKAEL
jgi:NAD(P)H-flavin reductase